MSVKKPIPISAEEFDRKFDNGEDITPYLDMSSARRPGREVQRVNVDFSKDFLTELDAEVARLGVTRQAYIKIAVDDKLHSRS